MPEGDTIWRAARTLNRGLAGRIVTQFETVFPKLARRDVDAPLAGRTVDSVEASGKWLEMRFSGDLILLTHMLMSGSWHIYRPGEKWHKSRQHMRIVVTTSELLAVAFNVPVAEFHNARSLSQRVGYRQLGPKLLASDFDPLAARANLGMHPEMEIGSALLKQSILAGLGNVFKSEVCFACRINPFRKISSLSEVELDCVVSKARELIQMNVTDTAGDQMVTYTGIRRTTGRSDPGETLWAYHRAGEPCRVCCYPIASAKQGPEARTTFWCPRCQK
jgi:endonuclease VIII